MSISSAWASNKKAYRVSGMRAMFALWSRRNNNLFATRTHPFSDHHSISLSCEGIPTPTKQFCQRIQEMRELSMVSPWKSSDKKTKLILKNTAQLSNKVRSYPRLSVECIRQWTSCQLTMEIIASPSLLYVDFIGFLTYCAPWVKRPQTAGYTSTKETKVVLVGATPSVRLVHAISSTLDSFKQPTWFFKGQLTPNFIKRPIICQC